MGITILLAELAAHTDDPDHVKILLATDNQ